MSKFKVVSGLRARKVIRGERPSPFKVPGKRQNKEETKKGRRHRELCVVEI
jgi:hypothetical protein